MMKTKIYICMSILMVFLLSLTMVNASEPITYRLTDVEMEMMNEYKKGNINTPEFIQMRKQKAEKNGLLDYCDENYFLEESFYDCYADAYLMKNGLIILDRYSAGFDSSSNYVMARTSSVTNVFHHRYTDRNGYYITNCYYQLSNGYHAFCAEGLYANPTSGSQTSDPYLVNNANLKKCLYYGYGGPGDLLTSRYGASGAIVLTDELVSNAYSNNCISYANNNGYHWRTTVSGLWNEIVSKPEPSNYDVYMVDVQGQAYNWQGVVTPIQKLAYGINSPKGSVQLKKASQLQNVSSNNASYTFKDAKYGLYSDEGCTNKIADFTMDENGYSNVVSDLSLKTYYVYEENAPKGYAKDSTVYPVNIQDSQLVSISVTDIPQTNLVDLILQKKDKGTKKSNASLKDAQYIFKFYDKEPKTEGILPLKTWTMKTDEKGQIFMKDEYKVSGDDFYRDLDGNICLPLGTITVQELIPPQGYILDSTVFVQKIESKNNDVVHLNCFKTFEVFDQVNRLKLVKVQENTNIPLSNVTFKHWINESTYIGQKTTNEKGEIELVALSKGKHKLQEFKTMDGYVLDVKPIEFEVLEDGTISGIDSLIRFENKVKPFTLKIQKKNDKNELLDGAVFGLFKDEECKECIEEKTTENGIVEFDELKNLKTYFVKEVKAPAGYQRNKQIYRLSTDFVPAIGQYDVYINHEKIDGLYVDEKVNMEFVNQRMVKLPHTGSSQTLLFSVLGFLIMYKTLKEKE